ncbi:MAG: DUF3618 domain-containing protein [Halomonas sp.]|nr:DUF3618 domain-containing protein [Halomonas sp.]
MSQHDSRKPEDIESDISQTRAHLDETLQELEDRLSPRQFMDSAYNYLREGGADEFLSNLGRTIKENPVPVLLTGIGLGWLMMAYRKGATMPHGPESHLTHYPSEDDDWAVDSAKVVEPAPATPPPTHQADTANKPLGTEARPTATAPTTASDPDLDERREP